MEQAAKQGEEAAASVPSEPAPPPPTPGTPTAPAASASASGRPVEVTVNVVTDGLVEKAARPLSADAG